MLDSKNSSDFLGSWINGNTQQNLQNFTNWQLLTSSEVELMETLGQGGQAWVEGFHASDFLGSWINGNFETAENQSLDPVLLTSSEVELMETFGVFCTPKLFEASDFLGSWINGNYWFSILSDPAITASDFLGSWINGNNPSHRKQKDGRVRFWLPRKLN